MNQGIVISATPEEVARNAASLFARTAASAIRERGAFTVALAGGSTPRRLYEMLATPEFRDSVDWKNTHFFWGDERYVPTDSADSNYRMAREALLSKVAVPEGNIHPVRTELATAKEAASEYEREIREFFKGETRDSAPPSFDLVLLGLGTNGHTASLFPHRPTLHEAKRWVIEDFVEEVNAFRITMTLPLLNCARAVAFLVTGGDKAEVLREVVFGPRDPERLPAQLIQPATGTLTWFADSAAAARFPRAA